MKLNRTSHNNNNDYLTKIYVDKGQSSKIINDYLKARVLAAVVYPDMSMEFQVALNKIYATSAWHMYLNYIIGVKEVTYYLAECFLDGFGVIQSKILANLTLSIGDKLGDAKSQEYLNKMNIRIPQHIDKLADKCVTEIKKYTLDVKGRDVTWEEMVAIAKSFDYFVQKAHGVSYYASINKDDTNMREYCACIEPIIEDNANIQVDIVGQYSNDCYCVII